ncbi:hypothetical protein GJA_994 [Janthinobacterium agaricidamnosum NBRC 102515 = DSM 9628]|uniref:Uncharacterized protein n=1 Tax=Janthinobacterium agaricidamnosum NBRC 102515 = DSM 9628 TaxID=1349767 RepID=W0UYK9_9BURK|nr:hypothetical protein GJA_994 [Janthinobacterium agaricidamnosum NBRC 102515 = DSM 9628]
MPCDCVQIEFNISAMKNVSQLLEFKKYKFPNGNCREY